MEWHMGLSLTLSVSLSLAWQSSPVHGLGWKGGAVTVSKEHRREENQLFIFSPKLEVFGTTPGAKLKLLLASLPGSGPSPSRGQSPSVLTPGRSSGCPRGKQEAQSWPWCRIMLSLTQTDGGCRDRVYRAKGRRRDTQGMKRQGRNQQLPRR